MTYHFIRLNRVTKRVSLLGTLFFLVTVAWANLSCPHCGYLNKGAGVTCSSCFSLLRTPGTKGPSKAAMTSTTTGRIKKKENINRAGVRVDLKDHIVPGAVTVFDFYADWCGPCKSLEPHLKKMTREYNNVYLRQIDIKNWKSPVTAQYNIRSIPSVWVYDTKGNLVAERLNRLNKIKTVVEKASK